MNAVADQLATVTDIHTRRTAVVALPHRTADLDRQRDRALEKALGPDVVADLRESVGKLLNRLARHPGDLQGLLYDLGRHMYVAGRMDQAADDALATDQADRLAQAALAQADRLVRRDGDGAA